MKKAPIITEKVNEFLEEYQTYSEKDFLAWLLANLQSVSEINDGILHIRIDTDVLNAAKEAARLSGTSLPIWVRGAIVSAVAQQVHPNFQLFDTQG